MISGIFDFPSTLYVCMRIYTKYTQGLVEGEAPSPAYHFESVYALLLSIISSSRYNNATTKRPVFQPIAIIIIYLDDNNNKKRIRERFGFNHLVISYGGMVEYYHRTKIFTAVEYSHWYLFLSPRCRGF